MSPAQYTPGGPAASVASHTTPSRISRPDPSSHSCSAPRRCRRPRHRHRASSRRSAARARRDRSPSIASTPVLVRTSTPWSAWTAAHAAPMWLPSAAHERHGQRLEDRHLEPTLPGGRRNLGTDEAGAHHDDSARRLVELGADRERVFERAQHVDAVEIGCAGNGSRGRAGREDHSVVGSTSPSSSVTV